MKRSSLFLLSFVLAVPAVAQYESGMLSLGGTASLATSDGAFTRDRTATLGIAPQVGSSLSDAWMVGAQFQYTATGLGGDYSMAHVLGASPFLRFNQPLMGFPQAGLMGMVAPNFTAYLQDRKLEYYTVGVDGILGVYAFFTPRFSLQAGLYRMGYSAFFSDYESSFLPPYNYNTWTVGLMPALSVSLLYHL